MLHVFPLCLAATALYSSCLYQSYLITSYLLSATIWRTLLRYRVTTLANQNIIFFETLTLFNISPTLKETIDCSD